ncbi:hypothetical protein GH714_010412 [Hevea brasiliensis]|uniref:Uncharacterized protein n=1 Tax=Hevea brasiliensis TaxID=3981 RepID=A0A6A6M6S4_HEVBR|nr:hypothetical protein GH714_010412 [Hevea brasiliensis]
MDAISGDRELDDVDGEFLPYKGSFSHQRALIPRPPGLVFCLGEESRIDSELGHLVGDIGEVEVITKEVVIENKGDGNVSGFTPKKDANGSVDQISANKDRSRAASLKKQLFRLQSDMEASAKSSPKGRSPREKPPLDRRFDKNMRRPNAGFHTKKHRNFGSIGARFQSGTADPLETGLDNPDLGLFLLKQQRI